MELKEVKKQSPSSCRTFEGCHDSCYAVRHDRYRLKEINRQLDEASVTDNETAAEAKAKEMVQFLMTCMRA